MQAPNRAAPAARPSIWPWWAGALDAPPVESAVDGVEPRLGLGLLLRVALGFAAGLALYWPLRDWHRHFELAWACLLLGDRDGLGLVWVAGAHEARFLGGCQRAVSVTLTSATLDTALAGIVLLPALVFVRPAPLLSSLRRLGRWTLALLLLQGPQLALLGWAAGQRLTGAASAASRAAELAGNAAGWALPLLIVACSEARRAAIGRRNPPVSGPVVAAATGAAARDPGRSEVLFAAETAQGPLKQGRCPCGSGKRWRRCCGREAR